MKAATFEFFGLPRRLQVGSLSVYMLRFSVFGFFSLYKVHRPSTVGWGFRGCCNYIGGGESGIQNGYQYVMGWTKSKSARIKADERCPTGSSLVRASGY